MTKHNEFQSLDDLLLSADRESLWDKEHQARLLVKIEKNINKSNRKINVNNTFVYISSIGAFLLLLFMGYHLLIQDVEQKPGQKNLPLEVNEGVISEISSSNFHYTRDTDEEKINKIAIALSRRNVTNLQPDTEPKNLAITYENGKIGDYKIWTQLHVVEGLVTFEGVFQIEEEPTLYTLDSATAEMIFIDSRPDNLPNFKSIQINSVYENGERIHVNATYTTKIADSSQPNGYRLELGDSEEFIISQNASIYLIDYEDGNLAARKVELEKILTQPGLFGQMFVHEGEMLLFIESYLP
ncbi:hypothetical protein [Fredinandcohnia quinoae]|uniref:Uncharacterized protein n=1 Tax=Fredinandcohnia quinoae TaxID=2918902 RepID=A0AAW5E736_9BACI|nr:hypothetical protein [Fredinandcohnia sp. SECRCQ15]MCH1624594.1 hypothetical protein [Fredinandcohnia sp. SECRCQ15]